MIEAQELKIGQVGVSKYSGNVYMRIDERFHNRSDLFKWNRRGCDNNRGIHVVSLDMQDYDTLDLFGDKFGFVRRTLRVELRETVHL